MSGSDRALPVGGMEAAIGLEAIEVGSEGRLLLMGSHCSQCDTRTVPPAPACPGCGSEQLSVEPQPDEGVLYSFTTLHVGPKQWDKPATIGYVDLDNGVRVFAHLRGQDIRIGGRMKLSMDRIATDPQGQPLHSYTFHTQKDAQP